MRRSLCMLNAVTAGAASGMINSAKMPTLYKLLIGETQFRNNVLLKVSNIEHNFGAKWQEEISSYAATLSEEAKALIERQLFRVNLTRYTTRELALYCGDGPERLDAIATKANIAAGKAFLEKNGEEKFVEHVKKEAANSNWSDARAQEFIDGVKQSK